MWDAGCWDQRAPPAGADVVAVLHRALGPSFETCDSCELCSQLTQTLHPTKARAGRSKAGGASSAAALKVLQPQHHEQPSASEAAVAAAEVARAARDADAAMAELLVGLPVCIHNYVVTIVEFCGECVDTWKTFRATDHSHSERFAWCCYAR